LIGSSLIFLFLFFILATCLGKHIITFLWGGAGLEFFIETCTAITILTKTREKIESNDTEDNIREKIKTKTLQSSMGITAK